MTYPMPALIGHRGLPSAAPENTRASIKAAAENDISWIEIDVTMAGDGSLVIMHDPTLKLFGLPDVALVNVDKSYLQTVDAGGWFHAEFAGEPLLFLDQLLELVIQYNLGLNLEIKINPDMDTAEQVNAVCDVLSFFNIRHEKLLISSFDLSALTLVRQRSRSLQIGVLYEAIPETVFEDVATIRPVSIHCDQSKLTAELAQKITAQYPLYCYTVNDTVTFEKLLGWGVNGVFCDRAQAPDMRNLIPR